MSYNITGTTITLTRGDTFEALVSATKRDGTQYIPVEGDVIRFAMKENYDDPRPLLVKDIPIDTMMLTLEPQDTADLNFGKYVYDIQRNRKRTERCYYRCLRLNILWSQQRQNAVAKIILFQ